MCAGLCVSERLSLNHTWDVFGPANVDHQLSVSEVTQRGQSLDVALGYCGIRHGEDALGLGDQEQRHHLVLDHSTCRVCRYEISYRVDRGVNALC